MDRSLAKVMKNGQIIKSTHNKSQGVIQKLGPSMVEILWLIDSEGSPMAEDADSISRFSCVDVERSITGGGTTIHDPTDPNILFLIRKCNVRS